MTSSAYASDEPRIAVPRAGGVGVAVAGLGALVVTTSFTVLPWLQLDRGRSFSQLSTFVPHEAVSPDVFVLYFSWLGWTLILAAFLLALCSSIGHPRSRFIAAAGAAMGVLGAVTTVVAVYAEAPLIMDISEGRFAALMRTADVGMWVAVGGFLAAGVGAAIAPLRVGLAPASS